MTFILHSTLAKDTIPVGDLEICRVLLMNNRNFPWLILVPRRENLREIYELSDEDYIIVMAEIRHITKVFAAHTQADKMNVATLGNQVPQLHIHIIARFTTDPAWPNPVWNSGIKSSPYDNHEILAEARKLCTILKLHNITKM